MALFLQDTIKLTPYFSIDAGLRYTFLTNPGNFSGFAPRLGFAWALDKKETWVAHLRLGIFSNAPDNLSYVTEVHRLDGVRQQQATVYSPGYTYPLTPIPGSIQVSTVKQFPPSLAPQSTFVGYFNLEHDFPHHWHVRGNLFWGEDWNSLRIKNINAPFVANSIGLPPDPTAALLAPRPSHPAKTSSSIRTPDTSPATSFHSAWIRTASSALICPSTTDT